MPGFGESGLHRHDLSIRFSYGPTDGSLRSESAVASVFQQPGGADGPLGCGDRARLRPGGVAHASLHSPGGFAGTERGS